MDYKAFLDSFSEAAPPDDLNALLQSLWYDAQGDWDTSHSLAQGVQTNTGSLVHAYLHRKEGDITTARYWYSMAGENLFEGSFENEWETLVKQLLD